MKNTIKSIIRRAVFSLLVLALPLSGNQLFAQDISLAGEWQFQTDPKDAGITEKWFSKNLNDKIKLPGSMLENDKGDIVTVKTQWTGSLYDSSWYFNPRMAKYRETDNLKFPFFLTPARHYVGAAWYKKEVNIPENWRNKRIILFLERPHTETHLWIDNQDAGLQNSMCVAQEFDVSQWLTPGKHTITLCIDNRIKNINVGQDSHSITDQTQGNWNGVVGKMELRMTENVWLDDVQIFPDVKAKKAHIKAIIKNNTGKKFTGSLVFTAESFNSSKIHSVAGKPLQITLEGKEKLIETDLELGDDMQTWDEFHPALYKLTSSLKNKKNQTIHSSKTQFGMREFKINGKQFEVNGRPTFLRGTVENCVFPLTGYAPMDVASWERIYRIAKNYGLNHFRFHSFCPPEAAFIAADLTGFYLQPEGPSWANHGSSLGDGLPIDQFIFDETDRMAKAYGNYPSYCMLAYGNEPKGKNQVAYQSKFVKYWKTKDTRRVYTGASVGGSWPIAPDNEYMVRAEGRNLPWGNLPSSVEDYRQKLEKFSVPFVTHEMGQWCAFPDFKEISQYTGVYKAKNFELFQEDLAAHGMAGLGESFLQNSGKLQVLSYKTELETAFRTPNLSGFQLLSLNDYSGQGTALVGVLNALWNEKGYTTAEEFKRFCNTTVLLSRIPKFVYKNSESFNANIEVAHYGETIIKNAKTNWRLTDNQGNIIHRGNFLTQDISFGSALPLGNISVSLAGITQASRLTLEVSIENTPYINNWHIWVYPEKLPEITPKNIYISDTLDNQTIKVLENGGTVFLQAAGKILKGKEIAQWFQPVFWNTSWFKMRPPHTLGIACNPNHPIFNYFPTESHSNLQWWELLHKAQVINFEDFPGKFQPLVQSIDTWFMNRKIGILAEMEVGKGKLMICSVDLKKDLDKRIVARQLLYSLTKYINSPDFKPTTQVSLEVLKDLFEKPSREQFNSYSKQTPDELKPKK
jgi:hypothetical protein